MSGARNQVSGLFKLVKVYSMVSLYKNLNYNTNNQDKLVVGKNEQNSRRVGLRSLVGQMDDVFDSSLGFIFYNYLLYSLKKIQPALTIMSCRLCCLSLCPISQCLSYRPLELQTSTTFVVPYVTLFGF